jgi:hypothetical protein
MSTVFVFLLHVILPQLNPPQWSFLITYPGSKHTIKYIHSDSSEMLCSAVSCAQTCAGDIPSSFQDSTRRANIANNDEQGIDF